jgi:hypothetical protein
MQRRCKHAFLTIEKLCFLRGPFKVVIKKSSEAGSNSSEMSSSEAPACQDMSSIAEEFN